MLHGDHHVPQGHQAGARVCVLRCGQLPGPKVELRKAQHVRRGVHLPHLPVDFVNAAVVRQQHVHLTGNVHPLRRQGGADHLADQGAVALTGGAGHVGGDGDIMPLRHHFRPFPPFFAVSYRS